MESFLPSEIARLVLGYLEDHKCEDAYEAFLKTSIHLVECLKMREEGRKFRTQVLGLNLLDILYEYSAIYSLVEERLKKVDPETASSLKHSGSLLDKITFLLNATSSGQTMLFSITLPPGKSPSTAHVRKRLRSTTINDKKKEQRKQSRLNIEDLSPIVEVDLPAPQPSTLETTSLSSLPGNANILLDRTENDIIRTPKRKLNSSRRSRANSEIPEEDENLDITALTKALLDNHQLHEKIAENINKVIRTPEISTNANISQSQDLCSAQNLGLSDTNVTLPNNFTLELDNAIKKIVQDTESDPLFENFLQEIICPPDETSDDNEDKGISDTSTPCQSTPETVKKVTSKRLRSSTKKRIDSPVTSSSEIITPTQIEHQNAAAVESIISMQKDIEPSKEEPKKPEQPTVTESNLQSMSQPSTSGANQSKKVPTQAMVYSDSIQYPPIQDNRVVILSSKISAGSQILTVQPGSFKTSYTDDILTMPTVIIKDDDLNPSNTLVVPQKTFPVGNYPPSIKQKKNPLILPHPIITTNFTTIPTETITYPTEETIIQQPTSNIVDIQQPSTLLSVPIIPTGDNEKLDQQKKTPEKRDTKQRHSLSTPRSGRSHIRALDFSTPPKQNSSRKSLSSPRVKRAKRATKPKPNRRRQSLFTSPLNMPIATRSPHEKLQGDWGGTEMLFETNKPEPEPQTNTEKVQEKIEPQKVTVTENSLKIEEKKVCKTKKKFDSWDHDLRVLLAEQSEKKSEQPPEKKKKNPQKKKNEEETTEKLSKSEEDAKAIEVELMKIEKKMNRKKQNENKPKPVRRKRQPKIKPAVPPEIKEVPLEVKDLTKKDDIQQDGEKVDETQNKNTTKETQSKETEKKVKTAKPRVKRKCNVASKKKILAKPEQINTVIVLSPSENCASKIIVIEQVKPKPIEEPPAINKLETELNKPPEVLVSKPSEILMSKPPEEPVSKPPEEPVSKPPEESVSKPPEEPVSKPSESIIITPDMAKLFENNEIKVKRNLTPMLITPYKDESSLLPITPRILTPFGVDASFSNLIKQNCGTIDLSSIMTPNFPMTPSFPITPNLQTGDSQSSFASRPTDYSNSSSYYQPSDSEQNQKLEQVLIEEAMKLESAALKRAMWTSTPDKSSNQELSVPPKDTMPNSAGEKHISKEPVLPKSANSFENDYNLSISSCDQSKENIQVERENTTVIHITPGQLRRGGKHISMMKNLLKPVDYNSDSELSNSPERKEKCEIQTEKEINNEKVNITDASSNLDETTHAKHETSESPTIEISKSKPRGRKKKELNVVTTDVDNKLNKAETEVSQRRITRSKSVDIRKNTTNEDLGETLTNVIIKGKKKSNATAVHGDLLEELEKKRKRVINNLNIESSKPNDERKSRSRGRPRSKSVDVRKQNDAKNLSADKQINSDTSITMNTSHTKKINSLTLEELEMDKKRIQEEIRIEKAKIRSEQKYKRPVKKGDPNRVTRARVTAKKILEAEESKETIKKETSYTRVEKATKPVSSPKKNTSIEDVAIRLKKDQDNVSAKEAVIISANTSIDSHNTSLKKDIYLMPPDDYEDLPRLHISSDEDTEDTNECDIVKDLKERGIHLIPKKPVDTKKSNLKDEDNPRIINSQKLDLNITKPEETTIDVSLDIEDSIPQNRIDKKIVIKSDVYLEESKKIDVSKVFSSNIVTESVIVSEKKTRSTTTKQQTLSELKNDNKLKQKKEPQKTKSLEKIIESPVAVIEIEKTETQKLEPEKKKDSQEIQTENTCISNKVIFEDKIITEDSPEFIKVIHDESIVITKTIKDYDFSVLNRKVNAKVFSEELNMEQDRVITFTPFIDVFTLGEKKLVPVLKPLDILFNEIQDDSTCSTVFDDYDESKNNKTGCKKSVDQKNKTKEPIREKICNIKLHLSPESIDVETNSEDLRKEHASREFDEIIKDNENKLENKEEDDLMTFAITNRDKDKKGSPVDDSASRKRRAESELQKSPNEKRAKTKDNVLLKTLNVDEFLSMLHGPSCSKM